VNIWLTESDGGKGLLQQHAKVSKIFDISKEFDKEVFDRPNKYVLTNMVRSIDGSYKVNENSSSLSNKQDRILLRHLRSLCDVILVGAETVRKENYKVPANNGERQVRLAIISESLNFSSDLEIMKQNEVKPIIYTSNELHRKSEVNEFAEIVYIDNFSVKKVIDHLQINSLQTVLCEGGPSVINQLTKYDLIDEINLTISPQMVGVPDEYSIEGAPLTPKLMRLQRVWELEGYLYCSWVRT